MGSYSGNDTTEVFWCARISTKDNYVLGRFTNKQEDNAIEIILGENKTIEKFYLNNLDVDLKDKVNQKLTDYLFNLYAEGTKELTDVEMSIDYDISGYYDPGVISGPPEHCYPPESDEDRTTTYCAIIFSDDACLEVPKEYLAKIDNVFYKEISEKEFASYDDGPEYEYDYDRDYDY